MQHIKTHQFSAEILRQYDIRGTVDVNLNSRDAYALGFHFAAIAQQRAHTKQDSRQNKTQLVVGKDGRLSSPMLAQALIEGMTAAGAAVTVLPTGPTPMLYFADQTLGADGAIMVTGSHNPADMNGFKMVMQHRPFFGADIIALGQRAKNITMTPAADCGQQNDTDLRAEYTRHLLGEAVHWSDQFQPRVVWDAGNGAAGEIMRMMTNMLPGQHHCLFAEIDGNFPNHHPDPTVPKNLQDLLRTMQEKDYDFGFAFDGDGDRIGVMLRDGKILWGDQLMRLLALDVLQDNPGAHIIADVKSSDKLFDFIAQSGGKPDIWKTGHALIKTRMREIGAPLAGEMSGHIFFADRNGGYDDALYAAMRLMTAINNSGRSLSQIAADFPASVVTPEVRVPCAEDRKIKVIAETQQRLRDEGIAFLDIDGMRVTTDSGWWLMRASNTEPILVLRAEADSPAVLDDLWQQIMVYVEAAGLKPVDYQTGGGH